MPNDITLTPEDIAGATGGSPAGDVKSLIGQSLITPTGQILLVQQDPNPVMVNPFNQPMGTVAAGPGVAVVDPSTGDSVRLDQFAGLPLVTSLGDMVTLDNQGNITGSRKLTQTEFGNYLAYGSILGDQSQAGGGSGGGVSINPVAALNTALDYYKEQVAIGLMPREQAKEEFDRYATIVKQQQDALYSANQSQYNYDNLRANIAAGEEDSLRRRQEDITNRALNIQQERTARQQDLSQNILPYAIPGATSMNIPLIGNLPLTQIRPDVYGDIAGLNQIPTVSPDLQVKAPAPTAPMQIPIPSMGDYPTFPAYTPPPMPGLPSWVNQIAGL